MRFLLCCTLAVFLPLFGAALDFCQLAEIADSAQATYLRSFILAIPFAVLAAAHLVVFIAAAAGAMAFVPWIRKVFGRDGLVAREPDAYARGDHFVPLVKVV